MVMESADCGGEKKNKSGRATPFGNDARASTVRVTGALVQKCSLEYAPQSPSNLDILTEEDPADSLLVDIRGRSSTVRDGSHHECM